MPEMIARNPLTDVERRAFSRKLTGWARTLAPREQDFLVALLRAAGGSGDDTAGHVLAMTSLTLVPPLPARHDMPKNAISNVRWRSIATTKTQRFGYAWRLEALVAKHPALSRPVPVPRQCPV